MASFAERQQIISKRTEMLRQEVLARGITLDNADSFKPLEGWTGEFSAAMVAAIWTHSRTPTFEENMIPPDYEEQLQIIIDYVQSLGE